MSRKRFHSPHAFSGAGLDWLVLTSLLPALLLGACPAIAQDEPSGGGANLVDIEHELSMDFETPHTRWGKPSALGKTRVLFFAPWYQGSTHGREIIELMQRFDLEADAVYVHGGTQLNGDGNPRWYNDPKAGTRRLLRLLEKDYDVLFFNEIDWTKLSEEVREVLLAEVGEGAGAVLVGNLDPQVRAALAGPNADEGKSLSRLIQLPQRDQVPFELGWETSFDYQMAEQGEAILRASGKQLRTEISISLPNTEIARSQLTQTEVQIAWTRSLPDTEVRLELTRWDGHKQLLGVAELSQNRKAAFNLPALRGGLFHIDAIAIGPMGVEDWATHTFTVLAERGIRSVDLAKGWNEVGETLSGTVSLEGEVPPTEKVAVRLVDKRDRVLARQEFQPGGRPLEFQFEVKAWMPMLLRVEAVLLDDQGEVASDYRFVRVTNRHQDQFNFVMWNTPSGDLAPYGVQSMAEKGVTAILQGGPPPLYLSSSELSYVPYAASFRWSSHTLTAMLEEDGVMKNGCLNDDAAMEKWVADAVHAASVSRQHGTLVYSLGDENAVRASCLSPHCLAAYRKYLADQYGTIEALNESWGTGFSAFEEIELSEVGDLPAEEAPRWFKEFFAQRLQLNRTDSDREGKSDQHIVLGDKNDEIPALQAENFPRWYDRQAFQNTVYVEWCQRFLKAFREIDPKSKTGFEGTDSFTIRRLTTRSRQGGDLDAFVRELEYFGPYEGPANEVVRSIASPKFPMGNWIGYSMIPNTLLDKTWRQIADCMNTVQWWRWDNLNGYHGFLMPTFDLFPEGRELVEDTEVIRQGLGDLLMECEMKDDGIAMLYSQPSTYIAHFDGNPTYGDIKRDHDLWHKAIHESGLQFRYVTDRMLRRGEFNADRFKVLILPLAFALGEKEAAAIREFVQDGGTLLADVRPGIYDGHCKPLEEGVLDDVFGIRRTGKQDAMKLDRLHIEGTINGASVTLRWGNWEGKDIFPQMEVDPTVETTTGRALGDAFPIHFWHGLRHPLCVVNEFGKGRAVLLNFPIYNSEARPLIEGILASAGVEPAIRVLEKGTGQPARHVEITRWKNGEIELVALLGEQEEEVEVLLPESRFIQDLKVHEPIDSGTSFATRLRPFRAMVFALSEKSTPAPQVNLDRTRVAPGETLTARITVPGARGIHAFKVSAISPWEKDADWLDQVLVVGEEGREVPIPVALNDPEGRWKFHLRDLYSGETTSAEFEVENSQ